MHAAAVAGVSGAVEPPFPLCTAGWDASIASDTSCFTTGAAFIPLDALAAVACVCCGVAAAPASAAAVDLAVEIGVAAVTVPLFAGVLRQAAPSLCKRAVAAVTVASVAAALVAARRAFLLAGGLLGEATGALAAACRQLASLRVAEQAATG